MLESREYFAQNSEEIEEKIAIEEVKKQLANIQNELGLAYIRLGHILQTIGTRSQVQYERLEVTEGKRPTLEDEVVRLRSEESKLVNKLQMMRRGSDTRLKRAA